MVLLQQLSSVQLATFADVAEYLLRRTMKAPTVYFVTDEYHLGLIKSYEWKQRKSAGTLNIKIERRDQKCPKQWKRFLALEENKKELVKFLFQEWAHPRRYYNFFSSDSALYVNVTEKFYKIKRVGNEVVFEEEAGLETTQEEADTKVFLSAAHCQSNNIQSCCISTNDTDIVYYAMYYQTTYK